MPQTTIHMFEAVSAMLKSEQELFKTKRRIVNAAIWLFAEASAEDKIKAIKAIAAIEVQEGVDAGDDDE